MLVELNESTRCDAQGEWVSANLEGEPYVALFLRELKNVHSHENLVWISLAIACSISEKFCIVLHMSKSVSRLIDFILDDVLRVFELSEHKTLKDFVSNSKGILYAKDLDIEDQTCVLEHAVFVLTTDKQVERVMRKKKLPHAFMSRSYRNGLDIRWRYCDRRYYERLKSDLLECVEKCLQIECSANSSGEIGSRRRRRATDQGIWIETRPTSANVLESDGGLVA